MDNLNNNEVDVFENEYLKEEQQRIEDYDLYRKYLQCDFIAISPQEYYDKLKNWNEFERFREPRRRNANKKAGITKGLRFKSFFSDAKKSELNRRKEKAEEFYLEHVKKEKEKYEERKEEFYKGRDSYNARIDRKHRRLRRGFRREVEDYFSNIIYEDRFTLDFLYDYYIEIKVSYDKEEKTLIINYKIPNAEDMLVYGRYMYNKEKQALEKMQPNKTEKLNTQIDLMSKIILRTIANVFYSDEYELINSIIFYGYLKYYDDSYGKSKNKNVVEVKVKRSDIIGNEGVNLRNVNPASFFERMKIKISKGLYDKSAKELRELDFK